MWKVRVYQKKVEGRGKKEDLYPFSSSQLGHSGEAVLFSIHAIEKQTHILHLFVDFWSSHAKHAHAFRQGPFCPEEAAKIIPLLFG